MKEDYFSAYLRYAGAGVSEPPTTFHRWGSISIIGALLGRQYYFPFGHSRIYPNQYINFMGPPGSRKSTAINIAHKLLKGTGYTKFAADRVSKEMFLASMVKFDEDLDEDSILDLTFDEPAQCFIVAEEFTDFVGSGNMEFITMLTKLWDNQEVYSQPKLHGKSVELDKPTVNMLAGNTAQGFALAFPPEALGNGFMSRTLFIQGETTGRKVTFPPPPDDLLKEYLVQHLNEVQHKVKGPAAMTPEAEHICDRVYNEFVEIDDTRFKHYTTRRFTHLLKLCLIISAADLRTTILPEDVLKANTILHHAEVHMPKALGEYGKSRFSDQTASVMSVLQAAHLPMSCIDIWKKVAQDFAKMPEMIDVLKGLQHADKIQEVSIAGKNGFLPKIKPKNDWDPVLLMDDWLTLEERT